MCTVELQLSCPDPAWFSSVFSFLNPRASHMAGYHFMPEPPSSPARGKPQHAPHRSMGPLNCGNSNISEFLQLLGSRIQAPNVGQALTRPASLPFFARTVCTASDLLSQKCFWDQSPHKRAVKCAFLPFGSAGS